jgi:isocitrate lyase
VQKLIAARLAADIMGVPTILIARTDAQAAGLITSDIDPQDAPFITGVHCSRASASTSRRTLMSISASRTLTFAPAPDSR